MNTPDLSTLPDSQMKAGAARIYLRMNPSEYPTPWQKKSIWAALTTLSVVAIGTVAVGLIWLFSSVIGFLQPILIPFAVAGVLAYLLEPVVAKIVSWGTSRKRAVLAVFAVVVLALTGILIWIIPAIWLQTGKLGKKLPAYGQSVLHMIDGYNEWAHATDEKLGLQFFPQIPKKIENPLPPVEDTSSAATVPEKGAPPAAPPKEAGSASAPASTNPAETSTAAPPSGTTPGHGSTIDWQSFLKGAGASSAISVVQRHAGAFITKSVGGLLGVLSMIIVPIYLYYFLIESKNIAESWGDYLPLRASAFKDEVIVTLEEINGYLIAFFRGQLLVSLINGTVTGILLVSFGLDFGMLIGVMLCFLGIIPYLGIIVCWVPAVIIAAAQAAQGGAGTWVPGHPWFFFPAVVTAIFFLVQQIDGLFVTPKIVGESVGLHPMTVIVSVFAWSLLLGGLLGAILAVPLTATLKVLLRRYIWERRKRSDETTIVTEETVAVEEAQLAGNPEIAVSK